MFLFFSIATTWPSGAQTRLAYLERPNMTGIHIYQDSASRVMTMVAGSDELTPSPTFLYQLDSNLHVLAVKKIETYGKNITSSAASNGKRTVVSRSVITNSGLLTANLICFDQRLNMQWSNIVETEHITYVNAIQMTPAGNVLAVGNGITRFPARRYSFLCNITSNGEKSWELTDYGEGDTTVFRRLALDEKNNIYTLGQLGKKGLLIKTNPTGQVAWQQTVFYRSETALSAVVADQGFVYLLGIDEGVSARDGQVFISKLTAAGAEVWTTVLRAPGIIASTWQASIKTTQTGEVLVFLPGTGQNHRTALATVQLDQNGQVQHSTIGRQDGQEWLPRDLALGKNAGVVGIGTLTKGAQGTKYPLYFHTTLPDLLDGGNYFSTFPADQTSIRLELLPVHINFVNRVVINLLDFLITPKDETGTVVPLKD